MSDAVGNAGVEDVLSSIRRLVAGDRKEAQVSAPEPEAPEHAMDDADQPVENLQDALVLTPSLRIEAVDDPSEEEMDPEAGREPDYPFEQAESQAEADRWDADAEQDISAAGSEWETGGEAEELPEQTGTEDVEVADEESFAEVDADDAWTDAAETGAEDMPFPSFVRPNPAEAPDPFDQELAESAREDESEREDDAPLSGSIFTRPAPRAGFRFDSVEAAGSEAVERAPKEANEPEEVAEAPFTSDAFEDPGDEGAEIQAFEPELIDGPTEDQGDPSEPAAPETDAAEAPFQFRSHFRGAVAGETGGHSGLRSGSSSEVDASRNALDEADPWSPDAVKPESADDETVEDSNMFAESDRYMDEEALRELVAELIHRELQGALGERITRNVRKLVRREIQRALAARDFD